LSVLNDEPSLEPEMVSVSVRVAHELAGGSFRTTWLTETAEPRSTCNHCGNALFWLSQYVFALPSPAFPAG